MLLGQEECKYCLGHEGYLFQPCACTSKVHENCLSRWRCSGINDQVFWKCSECKTCFQFEHSSTSIDHYWVEKETKRQWYLQIFIWGTMAFWLIIVFSFVIYVFDSHHALLPHYRIPHIVMYGIYGTSAFLFLCSMIGFFHGLWISPQRCMWEGGIGAQDECTCCMECTCCLWYGLIWFFIVIYSYCKEWKRQTKQAIRDTVIQPFYKVVPFRKIM